MKLVNNKLLILSIFFFGCNYIVAQEKQNAYILFDNNINSKCYCTSIKHNNDENIELNGQNKDTYQKGAFIICKKRFKIKPNSKIIELNKNETVKILTMLNFEKIISEIWKKENMNINEYFKYIYILEQISDNKYLGFEVYYDYNYFPDTD